MPIVISYLQDDKHEIILATVSGMNPANDMAEALDGEILPYVRSKAPTVIQVIYDMRDVEWTFPEFMAYLNRTSERRKQGLTPANQNQHFVGSGVWMNNWRSWLQKNYNIETSAFRNVEDALEFIKSLP